MMRYYEEPVGGMLNSELEICTHDEMFPMTRGRTGCMQCLGEWTPEGKMTAKTWEIHNRRKDKLERYNRKPGVFQTLLAIASLFTMPFLGGGD